jgi:hypothetical protein
MKAQVTVYIILGFVVLLGLGVVFFLQEESVDTAIETEIPGEVQYAGQQEVRTFMDSCIRDAVFNGLEILRLQAGYIDIPLTVSTVLVKNDQNKQIIVKDGIKKVVVDPNGQGNQVAYWLDSNNRLAIPSQEYVENSLGAYVEDSVIACVDEFNSFKQQGYVVEAGEMDASVELSDEVLVNIDYPISFEKGDVSFNEEEFILRVPVNLKKALDVQSDLVLAESIGSYLESNIKYLISLYAYNGMEKGRFDLPPLTFTDVNTNCKMTTWTLDEAEEKVFENIEANSKYFKIQGIEGEHFSGEEDISDGVYKGLTSDILVEPYDNTKVDFELNKNDIYFDVKPRLGEQVRPHRYSAIGLKFLPLFCHMRYQFKYTLKFPMVSKVTLSDSNAINVLGKTVDESRELEFSVPIGVFLCGNQNRECTGKPAYVEDLENIDFSEIGIDVTETMFCDSDMRLSQPIRLRTVDSYTFEPVSDVTVFYRCGNNQNDCLIDVSDETGMLESKFPLCDNGELYAIKDDYSQSAQLLSTFEGSEVTQKDYLVEPLKELDVEIKFVDIDKFMGNYYLSDGFTNNRCTGEAVGINDQTLAARDVLGENIVVSSNYGPSQVALMYPEAKQVKLASGEYSFSMLAEGQVVVNPSNYAGQIVSLNSEGGSYSGSYLLGNYNDLRAEFDSSVLKNAEKIVFYVPLEVTSRSFEVKDFGSNVVQPDGSLYKKGMIDDDCDSSTPSKEVEIIVNKEDTQKLFSPRLE